MYLQREKNFKQYLQISLTMFVLLAGSSSAIEEEAYCFNAGSYSRNKALFSIHSHKPSNQYG